MAELLQTLVRLGEKAGNLARIIRAERALFELLVEEKTGEAKNKRFVRDFKTLADVLIQEMIRHDVGLKFAGLTDYVYGEESNKFTNAAGESITVAVQSTAEETRDLLTKVLDGNTVAATLLAQAVHTDLMENQLEQRLLELTFDLDMDNIGIWIDPIDSTAEYIKGIEDESPESGVYQHGLQCAVVLIGAFDRETGSPVLGTINQPFASQNPETKSWTGRSFWGVHYKDICYNSLPSPTDNMPTPTEDSGLSFVMSSSEDAHIKDALSAIGTVHFASGAGYKMLCVIEGQVDAYILTKGSTFKWDSCGPHAILDSLCGGMVDLAKWRSSTADDKGGNSPVEAIGLKYNKPDREGVAEGERWANAGGVIAYRNVEVLARISSVLRK